MLNEQPADDADPDDDDPLDLFDEEITCWCGEQNPYFHEMPAGETCGGMGTLYCRCGGDQCVCHNHGEVECLGCEDCREMNGSEDDDA